MALTKKNTKAKAKPVDKTTAKAAAVKKTAKSVNKSPAKKSPAKKTAASSKGAGKVSCANKLTRVIVKHDAGWGNQVFIRGVGAGLDWQNGVLMQCIGDDEWLWEARVPCGSICFKLLVNDSIWSQGEDVSVQAGETVICHPSF